MDAELFNHREKCRCCFVFLKSKTRKSFQVTPEIRQKFRDVTSVEVNLQIQHQLFGGNKVNSLFCLQLSEAKNFSNVICETCKVRIHETSDFRTTMINNQNRLAEFERKLNPQVELELMEDGNCVFLPEYEANTLPEIKKEEIVKIAPIDLFSDFNFSTERDATGELVIKEETNSSKIVTSHTTPVKSAGKLNLKSALLAALKERTSIIERKQQLSIEKKRCPHCHVLIAIRDFHSHVSFHKH